MRSYERNEALFTSVWKPLHSICVLKPQGKVQRGRWVWVVTNGIRARHWAECQRGRWTPKGVGCEILYRLERRTRHSYKSVETSL